jgi:hypothetical protein
MGSPKDMVDALGVLQSRPRATGKACWSGSRQPGGGACGQVSGSGTHADTDQVEDSITIEISGENCPRLADLGDDRVSEPEPTSATLIEQDRNSHGVLRG